MTTDHDQQPLAWRKNHNRGRKLEVYHTDESCGNFPDDPVPVDPEKRDDLRECRECAGEVADKGKANWTYQQALREGSL